MPFRCPVIHLEQLFWASHCSPDRCWLDWATDGTSDYVVIPSHQPSHCHGYLSRQTDPILMNSYDGGFNTHTLVHTYLSLSLYLFTWVDVQHNRIIFNNKTIVITGNKAPISLYRMLICWSVLYNCEK